MLNPELFPKGLSGSGQPKMKMSQMEEKLIKIIAIVSNLRAGMASLKIGIAKF